VHILREGVERRVPLGRRRSHGLDHGRQARNLFLATGDIMDNRVQVTDVITDGVPQSLKTRHTKVYQQFSDR
jgi:hypothetical protein